MNLVRAELERLTARRFVQLMLVLLAVAFAVTIATTNTPSTARRVPPGRRCMVPGSPTVGRMKHVPPRFSRKVGPIARSVRSVVPDDADRVGGGESRDQAPAAMPTGRPSTIWSRYSASPEPSRPSQRQVVMPSVIRVIRPLRRLRSGMFDQTSPSTA